MADSVFRQFLSDEDLLSTDFRIRDPLNSIEGLQASRPDSAHTPIIVGFYDEAPSGGRLANPDEPYIWCCHCQKDTHWKGYVVEDMSGNRFTIGNKCGHDHYGASFTDSEKHFKERQARQGVLKAYLRLGSRLDGLEEELQSILSFEGLKAHEAKTREIQSAAPKGFQALRRAVERGSLSAVKKTRNYAAEEERERRYRRAIEHYRSLPTDERLRLRDEGLRPEPDDEPIIDSRLVDFGFVVGTSILGLDDVRNAALEAKRALAEFRKVERRGTEEFASKVINSVRRNLFQSSKKLRDSTIAIAFAGTFFERKNLQRISDWSDCFRGFSFQLEDGLLIAADDDRQSSSITPLDAETAIATPVLDRIHYVEIEDELIREGHARLEDPDDPTSGVYV